MNTIDGVDANANSLDVGRHLKEGKPRPLDSWDRQESQDVVGNEDDVDFNGPLYSDQEQVNYSVIKILINSFKLSH